MPHDGHMNMTGGGLGNVIGSRQRPGVPLSLYDSIQVGGKAAEAGKNDEKKSICVKMVNPAQASLDQAQSELKRERDMEKEEGPKRKKHKLVYDVMIK